MNPLGSGFTSSKRHGKTASSKTRCMICAYCRRVAGRLVVLGRFAITFCAWSSVTAESGSAPNASPGAMETALMTRSRAASRSAVFFEPT
jgi:hypothetical protein